MPLTIEFDRHAYRIVLPDTLRNTLINFRALPPAFVLQAPQYHGDQGWRPKWTLVYCRADRFPARSSKVREGSVETDRQGHSNEVSYPLPSHIPRHSSIPALVLFLKSPPCPPPFPPTFPRSLIQIKVSTKCILNPPNRLISLHPPSF